MCVRHRSTHPPGTPPLDPGPRPISPETRCARAADSRSSPRSVATRQAFPSSLPLLRPTWSVLRHSTEGISPESERLSGIPGTTGTRDRPALLTGNAVCLRLGRPPVKPIRDRGSRRDSRAHVIRRGYKRERTSVATRRREGRSGLERRGGRVDWLRHRDGSTLGRRPRRLSGRRSAVFTGNPVSPVGESGQLCIRDRP